jgi:hypothetical protein
MSLADAIRDLDKNPPPPLSIERHPVALRALGEGLDWIEEQRQKQHQGEAASPAA